jgi:phospholipid transport system substrate-binding protein
VTRSSRRRAVAGMALASVLSAGAGAWAAEPSDPAAQRIAAFDAQLLEVMKAAKATSVEARYHRLEPIVAHAFDIPTMIRYAVGPAWAKMSAAEHEQLATAFAKLTAASYAHNFNGWSGESFVLSPTVTTRLPDKLVATQIVSPHSPPESVSYRMQEIGGVWKIVDVYYRGGISQLATRRADFQGILAQGGAAALITHLNGLVDKQLK